MSDTLRPPYDALRAAAFALLALMTCAAWLPAAGQVATAAPGDKEQKRSLPFAIVGKEIDDVAMAGADNGRQVIYVNEARWGRLPEGVRNFIYEHEAAHHALGHASRTSAAGGFLHPAYTAAQEAEADERAARALVSRAASAQLKEVLAFAGATDESEYALPQWRREQIGDGLSKVFESPGSASDPDAVALLKEETFDISESEAVERPEVRYKVTYRNMGSSPLRCTLVFSTAHWLDNGKGLWRANDADIYDVSLTPNQSFVARGTLRRDKSPGPGSVIYYPQPDEGTKYVSCAFPSGAPKPQKPATADYPEALSKLLEANVGGFPSLRGPLEKDETTYKSLLSLAGMAECEVQINTGSLPEYQCRTADIASQQAAEAQYDALVKSLRAELPAIWETSEETKYEGRKVFEAGLKEDKQAGPTIRVWIMHSKKTRLLPERYKVVFTLRSSALD